MNAPADPSDATLVAGVLAGDREAFAAVYDRYGDRLYDFAHSMLRNPPEAEDAVADSFVIFAERLSQLREPARLRPWLYAVVRSECLRRLTARKRVAFDGEDALIDMADHDPTPDARAETEALRTLVWDAAGGLADRDRALLDLHLRHGLEGAELGEAMGVTASNAYVMVNRLKAQVERSLGALLIARLGRDDCDELDRVLADWDGTFSVLVRKRVARHVDGCDVCSARRKIIVSPWALLAGVPLVAAPVALRDRVVTETHLVAMSATGGGVGGPTSSAGVTSTLRTRGLVALGSAAAVVAVVAGVLLWPGEAPSTDPTSATPTASATTPAATDPTPSPTATTPSPTPTPTTSATPSPGTVTVSTKAVDLGTGGTTAAVVLTNTGGRRVDYTVASGTAWLTVSPAAGRIEPGKAVTLQVQANRAGLPEGDAASALTVQWGTGRAGVDVRLRHEIPPVVGAPTGPTGTCTVNRVSASATDNSALTSVVLSWTGPSGSGSAPMSFRGTWSAAMGQFPVGGPTEVTVTATDDRGNVTTSSATLQVNPCAG